MHHWEEERLGTEPEPAIAFPFEHVEQTTQHLKLTICLEEMLDSVTIVEN
jgi:hypothetical protein